MLERSKLEDILKKHLGKHYEWHDVGDWGNLIVDAMEEAYEEAVKEHSDREPQLRWVKASERLPDESGYYYIKFIKLGITQGVLFYSHTVSLWAGTDNKAKILNADIEWLEEVAGGSQPIEPEGKITSDDQNKETK